MVFFSPQPTSNLQLATLLKKPELSGVLFRGGWRANDSSTPFHQSSVMNPTLAVLASVFKMGVFTKVVHAASSATLSTEITAVNPSSLQISETCTLARNGFASLPGEC